MKAIVSLLLAPVALVHARINEMRSMARASNATAPTCGIGYTYCGYILQEEKRGLLPPAELCGSYD